MAAEPALTESSAAWELRAAWAARWEVGVSLAHGRRHRGYVEHVSATSAFALLWDGHGLLHVPCSLVLGVRRARLHDSAADFGPPVRPPEADPREAVPLPMPGQLALDVGDGDRPSSWADPRAEAADRRAHVARLRAEGKRRAVARERAAREKLPPSG